MACDSLSNVDLFLARELDVNEWVRLLYCY